MPSNAQPIPQGAIAMQPIEDFVVSLTAPIKPGTSTYTNTAFIFAPSVFIDGLLLTYEVRTDRRYVSFDASTQTITINNGALNEGESVQIFY
jgi:hypothetical protein